MEIQAEQVDSIGSTIEKPPSTSRPKRSSTFPLESNMRAIDSPAYVSGFQTWHNTGSAPNIATSVGKEGGEGQEQILSRLKRECLVFPTYAKRGIDENGEPTWNIRVRGWAFSVKGNRKKKLMLGLARTLAGVSRSHNTNLNLETRARLFMASNARNFDIDLSVAGLSHASHMMLSGDAEKTALPTPDYAIHTQARAINGHFSTTMSVPCSLVESWGLFDPAGVRKLLKIRADAENLGETSYGYVNLIEPEGISVISDIDDTIKHSDVFLGAKAVLSNTFLKELTSVSGMANIYHYWWLKGVSIHYVSNSPWELLPTLESFFHQHTFPVGSAHLKLMDRIGKLWQPADVGKREAIVEILEDFPERKFILVGDSGELDMELYAGLARQYPEQIIKIFIRDVTTPRLSQRIAEKMKASQAKLGLGLGFPRTYSSDSIKSYSSTLTKFQSRVEKVFAGLDPDMWTLFQDSDELLMCEKVRASVFGRQHTKTTEES
ncbi:hypothetical protein K493DRAFT_253317 [Basidiobolus meristosporus CBS 931.73]|uniref:Phosphatidate phosphatase APP1 catalytic domain-containing protein n=1 Tax=Basidiobolus meristosporus CBS 931.73 TaxID=1314790 RepID=A0A1Y1Z3N8_9FUNG|nr:hypothetical protein K493DRAFT_253317 [Basidiobolus meristosporus CBS 931.73]|eukprot:ORY04587.1 hypothetical protein K493DRAFT_253317 [Basidiobolus meristosporus CBS 931.73]